VASRIQYSHDANLHTILGAKTALGCLFGDMPPNSLLDVGCGTGTWLVAALELGVKEIYGIDGVPLADNALLFPREFFRVADLSDPIDLGRTFDLVLCLEVAEHLSANSAPSLVATLVLHSNRILFSAACPGQQGQHHVNCQWPQYWQELFNNHGYACDDTFRWEIWDIPEIEPWYRQNVFTAVRDPARAGKERRIKAVVHPEMFHSIDKGRGAWISHIEQGGQPILWYVSLLARALSAKLRRRARR